MLFTKRGEVLYLVYLLESNIPNKDQSLVKIFLAVTKKAIMWKRGKVGPPPFYFQNVFIL